MASVFKAKMGISSRLSANGPMQISDQLGQEAQGEEKRKRERALLRDEASGGYVHKCGNQWDGGSILPVDASTFCRS